MAIGTQDGTGTEYFFERALNETVPRCVLLNGTDKAKPFLGLKKPYLLGGRIRCHDTKLFYLSDE